jgi:hypothetical protein
MPKRHCLPVRRAGDSFKAECLHPSSRRRLAVIATDPLRACVVSVVDYCEEAGDTTRAAVRG